MAPRAQRLGKDVAMAVALPNTSALARAEMLQLCPNLVMQVVPYCFPINPRFTTHLTLAII
jgi:hypothetical protein